MKKWFLPAFIFLFAWSATLAQNEYDDQLPPSSNGEFVGFGKKGKDPKVKKDLSRIRIGGDFGLSFTEFAFFAEVSPLVGYQLVENRLEVGAGPLYQHTNVRRPFQTFGGAVFFPAKINIIGGRNYARLYIWEGLFGQVEGLLINYRERPKDVDQLITLTLGNALAGGGYTFNQRGSKVFFNVAILTNLIINPLYPRRTVIPRIGLQVSL
jgi:hypothetical protein